MKKTAIYGLYDPRKPHTIMYVGKGLARRAATHWNRFVCKGEAVNPLLHRWFVSLQSVGIKPLWRFLEVGVHKHLWELKERHWIARWRELNECLCNIADGGNSWPIQACRNGGHISGASLVRTKRGIFARSKKQVLKDAAKGGHIGGLIVGRENVKQKRGWYGRSPEKWSKDSTKAGLTTAKIPGHMARAGHITAAIPGHSSKAGRIGGLIAAGNGQLAEALHTRWHTDREIVNPDCRFCVTRKRFPKRYRFPRLSATAQ